MLTVGSFVSGYRVERVLGAGGMGAVYLVANPELPRREALKLLSTELSRDEGFRARFVREADVASRLEHPNIVPIYRRGQTEDGQLWIAMQFVEGTDADQAQRSGTMSPHRAIHIAGEVAKALDYAHRRNVIHRDVKPANFLLAGPPGPEERVLLADFGIARALDDAGLTGTGEVLATVAYAAPEVIAGDPVGPAADQYSLACSLFRLLTGKAPFAGIGAQAAVMMAHLSRPAPRVSEQAPWLPPALDGVIATALAKNPAQRYPSCGDFAAAANAALHAPDPRTAPTVRLAPTAPVPKRRRRGVAILSAAVGSVVVAAGAVAVINWPAHQPEAAPHPTTSASVSPSPPAMALADMLLSSDELSAIVGVSLQGDPIGDALVDGRKAISEAACAGAFGPAQTATYADSNWTAAGIQWVGQRNVPEPDATTVEQAVVSVPTAQDADYLFMNQSNQWGECMGRPFAWHDTNWTFGQLNHLKGDMVAITMALDEGTRSCGRALATGKNVLVDVKVCRPGEIAGQASDIAAKIQARIRGS